MTIKEPLVEVLNELKSGQLKGENRTALLSINPGRRKEFCFLSDLLTNLNATTDRCFTSSVEVEWITSENLSACLTVLGSVKGYGIGYLAFDDNGHVSDDPYLATLRYLAFGITPTKSYIADLRIVSLETLTQLLTNKSLKLIYNALPFLGILRHRNIDLNSIGDLRLLDIILMCGLGNLKPNLSDTILRHLGEDVTFPKVTHLLCKDDVTAILTTQAAYLFSLAENLYPKIRQEKLGKVAQLEMQSLFCLSDIQYNGIPFSRQMVKDVSLHYLLERDSISEQLHSILDHVVITTEGPLNCTVNLDSPQQLLKALHRIGLTLPNTKESVLLLYKNEHAVVPLLIRYKQLCYLIQHTGESYMRYIHPITQRIHPNVNPVGTRTYRIIITEPNIQGVQHGNNRKLFRAPEGYVFVTGDYKQIEVLIYAVLSKDVKLLADCSGNEDVYIIIARMFFNRDSITAEDRKKIKPVVLGLLYNMTDYGICRYSRGFGVEITMAEAATWRSLFFNRYERVESYHEELAQKSRTDRSVESILGRKRCFDTRRVIVERPDCLSHDDFDALVGSVANYSPVTNADCAIYTVDSGDEATKLQDQLFELNLETTNELADPPLGAVYNGVSQMSCVDLIKTAMSLIYPNLKRIYQIVNTAHDDLTFIVSLKDSLVFADNLKKAMENASFELFKPSKAMVTVKIGEDYDL